MEFVQQTCKHQCIITEASTLGAMGISTGPGRVFKHRARSLLKPYKRTQMLKGTLYSQLWLPRAGLILMYAKDAFM